jgi:thymidylate synthase
MNVKNQPLQATESLERMEQVMPRRSMPMEYRVKFDLASFYKEAGNKSRNREYLHELIQELKPLMNKSATEQLSQYNPHIVLFQCYDELEMFKEAEDLLPVIKSAYSQQQGIDQIIAQLRDQIQSRRAVIQTVQTKQAKLK